VGFLERDQAAGELEQREVILWFLRPADQECAVAVEPGVAGFDDPAPRARSRSGSFELELVGTAADVRGVTAAGGEVVDPGVGVAAVQAQALRLLGRRLGSSDRDRVERRG
jgi:hypothetical protein